MILAWRRKKWQGWGWAGSIKHALMLRKHGVFMKKGNYMGDKIVLNLSWNEMFYVWDSSRPTFFWKEISIPDKCLSNFLINFNAIKSFSEKSVPQPLS